MINGEQDRKEINRKDKVRRKKSRTGKGLEGKENERERKVGKVTKTEKARK